MAEMEGPMCVPSMCRGCNEYVTAKVDVTAQVEGS